MIWQHARHVPIVLRGGMTGNHGRSMPLNGRVIIETTTVNRILETGDGLEGAGTLMADIKATFITQGPDRAIFPPLGTSPGSVASGALSDPGNLQALRVSSDESAPQAHMFEAEDVPHIHQT